MAILNLFPGHPPRGDMKIIVFTDLDGSLLDHEDYSFTGAAPSLRKIRARGIPLVIVSSKTRKEIEAVQEELGIRDPFIAENGGGIFFPLNGAKGGKNGDKARRYRVVRLGKRYEEVRKFVEETQERFGIRGFGDMTVEEIAGLTDLPVEKARLAAAREFTEPFLLAEEGALPLLEAWAAQAGLKITRGGRFHHLISMNQDKGKAVQLVEDSYREGGDMRLSVGLGDSRNDVPMLSRVSIPILIPHPDGSYEDIALPNLRRAKHPGSRGWNEAVEAILTTWKEIVR